MQQYFLVSGMHDEGVVDLWRYADQITSQGTQPHSNFFE